MTTLLAALALAQVPVPGQALKPFELRAAGGPVVSWKPGRRALFTVCAFWCDTWKEQFDRAAKARDRLSGLPIDWFTVSADGRWAELARAKPPGTLLLDPGMKWSGRLGIDRIPYTLAVDERGRITLARYGILRSDEIVRALTSPTRPGDVYLTFDDFPAPAGNDELLDVLRRLDVRATFFCIGQNLKGREAVVRRAVREGHSLQMHSWGHRADAPNLARLANELRSLGAKPSLYRPPGSSRILDGGQVLGLPVVDPYDYRRPGRKELLRRIGTTVKPRSVIQLHAGVSQTIEALPSLVESLRERGFELVPLTGRAGPD